MTKAFIEAFSVFAAAAVAADGQIAKEEKDICKDICNDLEIKWTEFEPMLDKEIKKVGTLKEDELEKYLKAGSKKIKEEEANILFEASINLVLADKVLSYEECETISAIAEILDIPTEVLLARVAFSVQEDDIKVDVEDELSSL